MESSGIVIDGLSVAYGEHHIFDHFNATFEPNEIVSILGPSGCGKTTLLNSIIGIKSYSNGVISGLSRHRFGYVFQEPRLIPWLTVEKNLAYALSHRLSKETYIEKRNAILDVVELSDKLHRYPSQLSGGEQQRIALARAFLIPSDGLLMDEAFKGLDLVTKQAIQKAFLKLWLLTPKTVIAVSHDVEEAVAISDRILLFSRSPVQIIKDIRFKPHQIRSTDETTRRELVAMVSAAIQKES